MFANRISSSTSCSICLPETSPPSSARGVLRHRFESCNTSLQTAFGEQLFDVAERERVPKIPAHGTKNQFRRRLPPLEDCRSGYVLHDLFRLPATPANVATHPSRRHLRAEWRRYSSRRRRRIPSDEGNPDPNSLCSNRSNESLETKTANDLIGQL